jgi:hypothetical protein
MLTFVALLVGTFGIAPAAHADTPFGHPMPSGHWTFVRSDAFLHYACKIPMSGGYGPVYRVKTLTWYNGNADALSYGIGVYVATTRFSNANIIDSKTNPGWLYGFNGNEVWASAYYADRLWMQGSYYGPSRPWTDGYPVAWLTTC